MILEIEYLNGDISIIEGVNEFHINFDIATDIPHKILYNRDKRVGSYEVDLRRVERAKLEGENVYYYLDYDLESNVVNVYYNL